MALRDVIDQIESVLSQPCLDREEMLEHLSDLAFDLWACLPTGDDETKIRALDVRALEAELLVPFLRFRGCRFETMLQILILWPWSGGDLGISIDQLTSGRLDPPAESLRARLQITRMDRHDS